MGGDFAYGILHRACLKRQRTKDCKRAGTYFLKGSTLSGCKHGNAKRHVTSNSVWRTGCSPNTRAGDGKAPGTHISVSQLLIASHLRLPYLIPPPTSVSYPTCTPRIFRPYPARSVSSPEVSGDMFVPTGGICNSVAWNHDRSGGGVTILDHTQP